VWFCMPGNQLWGKPKIGGLWSRPAWAKSKSRPNKQSKGAGTVDNVVGHLPCKCEVLNSINIIVAIQVSVKWHLFVARIWTSLVANELRSISSCLWFHLCIFFGVIANFLSL
jgi:hypothetical protein